MIGIHTLLSAEMVIASAISHFFPAVSDSFVIVLCLFSQTEPCFSLVSTWVPCLLKSAWREIAKLHSRIGNGVQSLPRLKSSKAFFPKIMTSVQQENLAMWFSSDAHILICRHQLLGLINTSQSSMNHCHSSPGSNHDSFLSSRLWINLLQARNYASESSNAFYHFCLFASIVDGDSGVWAARVALVARLL